jgi:hypothetical protein
MQTSYNVQDRAIVSNAKQVRICTKAGVPICKHYCSIRPGRLKRATCNHLRKKPFLAALLSSARNLHHTDRLREYTNPLRKGIQQWKLMECIFFSAKEVTSRRVRNHLWTVLPVTVRLPFILSDPQIYSKASVFTRLRAPDQALPSFMRSLRSEKVSLATSAMPDTLLYATVLSYDRNQWQKVEY